MLDVDDVLRRALASQLRAIASSGIEFDDADVARAVMRAATGSADYDSRELALAVADLVDRPICEPYVSKVSGLVCCSVCRKPIGDYGSPEVVNHCRSCGAKVDKRILRAIDEGAGWLLGNGNALRP